MTYTCEQIARQVDGQLVGQADVTITGVEQLDQAQPGQLSFVRDQRHAVKWQASHASAALVGQTVQLEPGPGRSLIFVADADLAMARVLGLFQPPLPQAQPGVHPAAVVDPSASLGQQVSVGPGCYVGPGVVVGDRTVLYANAVLLDQARIGADCILWPGAVIGQRCQVGNRCILHANVTIGADGFNYRPSTNGAGLTKLPHIGAVRIDDDVEIGAGTCVDRGKFSDTRIGQGTKIDNLCQIGHNCQIGRWCLMAGLVGLAGSVVVEDHVMIGGRAAVRDNTRIGRGARISALASVHNNVPPGVVWGGSPAQDIQDALREYAAVRKLPELLRTLRQRTVNKTAK